jgi:hypothetical protein
VSDLAITSWALIATSGVVVLAACCVWLARIARALETLVADSRPAAAKEEK